MAKKDMKSALKGSLIKEEKAVSDRFERAERLLGDKEQQSAKPSDSAIQSQNTSNPKDFADSPEFSEPKVIRDSFTMPQSDRDLITALKKRALKAGVEVTKSELLRAGLKALDNASAEEFVANIEAVEKIKTGRPKMK